MSMSLLGRVVHRDQRGAFRVQKALDLTGKRYAAKSESGSARGFGLEQVGNGRRRRSFTSTPGRHVSAGGVAVGYRPSCPTQPGVAARGIGYGIPPSTRVSG